MGPSKSNNAKTSFKQQKLISDLESALKNMLYQKKKTTFNEYI